MPASPLPLPSDTWHHARILSFSPYGEPVFEDSWDNTRPVDFDLTRRGWILDSNLVPREDAMPHDRHDIPCTPPLVPTRWNRECVEEAVSSLLAQRDNLDRTIAKLQQFLALNPAEPPKPVVVLGE